jgi:hypothetical protein
LTERFRTAVFFLNSSNQRIATYKGYCIATSMDEHWALAEKVFKFLELFYDSIVALSGVYYPHLLL